MPRKLRPSELKERIAPQNFSRGLASVVTTMVPGRNGLAEGAFSMHAILAVPEEECNWVRSQVTRSYILVLGVWLIFAWRNYGHGSRALVLLISRAFHKCFAGLPDWVPEGLFCWPDGALVGHFA